jgi:hypothetical protein
LDFSLSSYSFAHYKIISQGQQNKQTETHHHRRNPPVRLRHSPLLIAVSYTVARTQDFAPRTSFAALTLQTAYVARKIPPNAMTVFDAQFLGWTHQPPIKAQKRTLVSNEVTLNLLAVAPSIVENDYGYEFRNTNQLVTRLA